MMGVRTFTFVEGGSNKFWNVELAGTRVTVTFGRAGTKGQTQVKEFADAAAARKAHDKLVKEKLAKGYVETTGGAPAAGSPLRQALEDALAADFDDVGAHMAYADWLMEQGDPKGEFIQVQLALEDEGRSKEQRQKLQQREKALLKKHGREWLGSLAEYLLDLSDVAELRRKWYPRDFAFVRGWLGTVETGELSEGFAKALTGAAEARLLRRLAIRCGDDYEPPLAPFAGSAWIKDLRAFQIGREEDQCHVGGEGAVEVIAHMTRLDELRLFAHRVDAGRLFALKTLGNLRVLEVNHLTEYPLERLAKNPSLGKLTHLLIHPHALEPDDEEPYLDLAGLRAVINSSHLPSLTHLRLQLSFFGDKGCQEVVKSGVLKRLKVLDLMGGTITDKGAETLAACPDVAKLELLELSRNALTAKGVRALQAAGAKVQAHNQWEYDPENPGEVYDMEFLYEGDIE
jgi:uncharacterized protein (TIGR02996 family)